jgi:hypothetical protein
MIFNGQSFILGCIGAIAPETLRFYQLRNAKSISLPKLDKILYYLACVTPMILMGGILALILEPSTSQAAFYIGIGTPLIITAIAKKSGVENITLPEDMAKKIGEQELIIKGLQQSVNEDKSLLANAEEESQSSTNQTRDKSFLIGNLGLSISFLSSRIDENESSLYDANNQLEKYKERMRQFRGKNLNLLDFVVKFIRAV